MNWLKMKKKWTMVSLGTGMKEIDLHVFESFTQSHGQTNQQIAKEDDKDEKDTEEYMFR